MLNKVLNINDIKEKFEHYELEKYKNEGSYIIIKKDDEKISIKIDRFSTIPFYYYVFKDKFYGSTSLQDLINKKPGDFSISLNKEASLFFLKTNTFLNDQTLVKEIFRIPYGCILEFNKKSFKVKIIRHWNFSPKIENQTFYNALDNVYQNYELTMKKYTDVKKVATNISGGYDSRQIIGFLVNNNIKFTGYTYGFKENPDQEIAIELSKKHNFNLIFKEWKNINFYKDNFENDFEETDGMIAFHHFHPLNIVEEQKNEDVVLYGHFLDFFLQAWNYKKILENISTAKAIEMLEKNFDQAGHFSIISGEFFNKLVSKEYSSFFSSILKKELKNLDFLPPEKMYDAMYFLHHGTRRLLPQVQAASKKAKYALPGLNSSFFDSVWKIPGRIKKNNSIKEMLIKKYYQKVCDVPILFNNYKLDYIGPIPFISNFYKLMRIIRSKKIGILKPYYDFWGKEIYNYIEKDLKKWMDNEINSNALLDYNFLNKDFILKYLKSSKNNFSYYGTLITLSKFIKRNF